MKMDVLMEVPKSMETRKHPIEDDDHFIQCGFVLQLQVSAVSCMAL